MYFYIIDIIYVYYVFFYKASFCIYSDFIVTSPVSEKLNMIYN